MASMAQLSTIENELGDYVNKRHFEAPTFQVYQSGFQSHAMKVVQIENFLNPSTATQLSQFLSQEALFDPIFGLYSKKPHVTDLTSWTAAPEADRFFHYEMLKGTKPDFRLSANFLSYLKFKNILEGKAFREFASKLTSIAVDATSAPVAHRLDKRHYLKPHDDREHARKIAYILYLSPNWCAEYGGSLNMTSRDGLKERFLPEYNSLILFDVTAHDKHHIEPVANVSPEPVRYTLGGWFTG